MNELFSSVEFNNFVIHFGYFGIFLFLVTVDQLTPIPEEIMLLTIGYLSAHTVFNPILAGMFSLAGFIAVDTVYYFLAKSGNKFLMKHFERRKNSFVSGFKEKLQTHFAKTLLILCFIPRMRLFAPILAGILKVDYKKFILFDTIGLAVFTFVYIFLGIIFHAGLNSIIAKLEYLQHTIFIAAMVIIEVLVFIYLRKKQQHKKNSTLK